MHGGKKRKKSRIKGTQIQGGWNTILNGVAGIRLNNKVTFEQKLKKVSSKNPCRSIIFFHIILDWIFYSGKHCFKSTIILTTWFKEWTTSFKNSMTSLSMQESLLYVCKCIGLLGVILILILIILIKTTY